MKDEKFIIVYTITDEDGTTWHAKVFDDKPQAIEWLKESIYLTDIYPHSMFRLSEADPLWK